MADFGFTPNLIATGNINPFRFVELGTATPFTGSQANAGTDLVVGVADGSVRRFDASVHAAAGDPISLQPTNTVQVECGGNVTTGALIASNASGQAVVASGAGTVACYVALEGGASGEIIRAFRFGTRVLTA